MSNLRQNTSRKNAVLANYTGKKKHLGQNTLEKSGKVSAKHITKKYILCKLQWEKKLLGQNTMKKSGKASAKHIAKKIILGKIQKKWAEYIRAKNLWSKILWRKALCFQQNTYDNVFKNAIFTFLDYIVPRMFFYIEHHRIQTRRTKR